jgi:hypothetical protein
MWVREFVQPILINTLSGVNMAIQGQQLINVGLPNESSGSDSLRDAFNKINTNFNTVFSNANPNINAGNGITVNTSGSNITVSANLIAGNGIELSNANGAIVITNSGNGGNGGSGNVTSVQVLGADSNARILSSGGPITSSGTITLDLANSNVSAGTYTNPTLTVDRFGRVTAAANNIVAGTVTSVGLAPGNGISIAGGPITASGLITVTNTGVTSLTAGTGVILTGSNGAVTISATGGGGGVSFINIISNSLNTSGGPITSAGNITVELRPNTIISGSMTANTFIGNGSSLSSLTGSNVTGQVANALVAGTVYTNSQPNITTVGTLTNLNVGGNANINGNLTVNGNLVYVNVEELSIEDPIINLNTGANGVPPVSNTGKDVGTALNYYDTQARIAFMGWDVSNTEFGLASIANINNEVVTFTTYGNLRVGNIIGNGQALTGLNGSNVIGIVANSAYSNTAGTVITNAQPNITSVGTLSSLAVSGNVSAGNADLGNAASANYFVGNGFFLTDLNLGNATVSNANYAAFAGNITTASQPNITSLGTLTVLDVDGNIVAANVTANTGVFTGNGSGLTNLAGANVTGQVGNALVAGTVYTNAQPNITSVGTLTGLNVNGNITAANITANTGVFTGNGSGLSALAGSNVIGSVANATFSISAGNANTAGTVTTNAQPNITSVGTLTSLAVTGNASAGNLSTGGVLSVTGNANVGNIGANTGVFSSDITAANIYANTGTIGSNVVIADTLVRTIVVTFATLPAAATAGAGSRAFISDGNIAATGNFAAQVQGGGANNVPVYSDGSNWLIG